MGAGRLMRIGLIFPPGWSLMTGSPHLALPLLKATLERAGFESRCFDLNWEAGQLHGGFPDLGLASDAVEMGSLEALNDPYFRVEDRLMKSGARHGGTWNAQIGFEYDDRPQDCRTAAFAAVNRSSPYDAALGAFLAEMSAFSPRVIGLSISATQQILPSLQLCRRLRDEGYRGLIVWGGNTVSRLVGELACPELFDFVDGLVVFQGEEPMLALCRAVRDGEGLETVPNLVWRDGDTLRTNTPPATANLDQTPCPDFGDLPVGHYAGVNYLTIVAARGCYYGKCSFCAIPYGWGQGGYAGARSPGHVVQDVARLSEKHGIRRFKFVDEALSPSFMRAFSKGLLAEGVNVEWEGYTRLEKAWNDSSFVELVAAAGFRKGYFGLELAPSAGRSVLQKNDAADPVDLLRLCADHGVRAHLFCMFGYPGSGAEDAWATTEFLLRHQSWIDTADIFPWTLAKHTHAPGVRAIDGSERNWALEFDHVPTTTEVLSSAEIRELATECEELVWSEVPRLLHPTYRLISPWQGETISKPQFADSLAVG